MNMSVEDLDIILLALEFRREMMPLEEEKLRIASAEEEINDLRDAILDLFT